MFHAVNPLADSIEEFFKIDPVRAKELQKQIDEIIESGKGKDFGPKQMMAEMIEKRVDDYTELAFVAHVFGFYFGEQMARTEKKLKKTKKLLGKLGKGSPSENLVKSLIETILN